MEFFLKCDNRDIGALPIKLLEFLVLSLVFSAEYKMPDTNDELAMQQSQFQSLCP